ncbi:hypothetical protein HJG60_008800 [Phyllostomus discolor]|uniref:Uncharacterized protein n=1 Tax=Phyllostomus discolor TaxID=89673 RepID=A0A833YZD4_9CHIR|nr:hypothetical protein HJG60_008800 [Phyllostomus discolor]
MSKQLLGELNSTGCDQTVPGEVTSGPGSEGCGGASRGEPGAESLGLGSGKLGPRTRESPSAWGGGGRCRVRGQSCPYYTFQGPKPVAGTKQTHWAAWTGRGPSQRRGWGCAGSRLHLRDTGRGLHQGPSVFSTTRGGHSTPPRVKGRGQRVRGERDQKHRTDGEFRVQDLSGLRYSPSGMTRTLSKLEWLVQGQTVTGKLEPRSL